ncbi:MAG: hypothetical protein JSV66_18840 [Trueperaceae bacterium]|nr:MAG: hypothetical protein JSV66_18840 [Trueperaceae bacterium]
MSQVMGDVEVLIASIHRRAEQRGLVIEAEAEQRAAEVIEQSRVRAQEVAEMLRRQSVKEAQQLEQRLVAQGTLERRRRLLVEREALLERVWAQAEVELRLLTETPDYELTLKTLACEAARSLGVERLVLAADPKGYLLLSADRLCDWGREFGVVFERAECLDDCWGGLLARHGRLRYDATFSSRLTWARERLRERAYALLGGDV